MGASSAKPMPSDVVNAHKVFAKYGMTINLENPISECWCGCKVITRCGACSAYRNSLKQSKVCQPDFDCPICTHTLGVDTDLYRLGLDGLKEVRDAIAKLTNFYARFYSDMETDEVTPLIISLLNKVQLLYKDTCKQHEETSRREDTCLRSTQYLEAIALRHHAEQERETSFLAEQSRRGSAQVPWARKSCKVCKAMGGDCGGDH